jgi:hypothetical protein
MGSGKGSPEFWVAVVKPGRIMFEVGGVPQDRAEEALRRAAMKMPMACRTIARLHVGVGGDLETEDESAESTNGLATVVSAGSTAETAEVTA